MRGTVARAKSAVRSCRVATPADRDRQQPAPAYPPIIKQETATQLQQQKLETVAAEYRWLVALELEEQEVQAQIQQEEVPRDVCLVMEDYGLFICVLCSTFWLQTPLDDSTVSIIVEQLVGVGSRS
ncbi:hypothetical protein NDU88_000489 [Pleurodeles waltl]|uniref:Uncharacterized protein n=1 Tax=Pleurodeles waltl TaxID=8319 RepID=A0AAV7MI95_PLEWA|nr:hypothetical protein NDU88_000489 [Pleurodeles waltl]